MQEEGFLLGYVEFDMPLGPPARHSGQKPSPRCRYEVHPSRVTMEAE